jgi:hypothetical protein
MTSPEQPVFDQSYGKRVSRVLTTSRQIYTEGMILQRYQGEMKGEDS